MSKNWVIKALNIFLLFLSLIHIETTTILCLTLIKYRIGKDTFFIYTQREYKILLLAEKKIILGICVIFRWNEIYFSRLFSKIDVKHIILVLVRLCFFEKICVLYIFVFFTSLKDRDNIVLCLLRNIILHYFFCSFFLKLNIYTELCFIDYGIRYEKL